MIMNKKVLTESISKVIYNALVESQGNADSYIHASDFNSIMDIIKRDYENVQKLIARTPSLGEIGAYLRRNGMYVYYDGFSTCTFRSKYVTFHATNYTSKWKLSDTVSFMDTDENEHEVDIKKCMQISQQTLDKAETIYNGIVDIINSSNPYDKVLPMAENIDKIVVVYDNDYHYRSSSVLDKFETECSVYNISYHNIGDDIINIKVRKRYNKLYIEDDAIYINSQKINTKKSIYFNADIIAQMTPKEKEALSTDKDTKEYKIYNEGNRTRDYITSVVGLENAKKAAYKFAMEEINDTPSDLRRNCPSQPRESSDKHNAIYAYDYYEYDGYCYWIEVE